MQLQYSNSILFFEATAIVKFVRLSDSKEVRLETAYTNANEFRDMISNLPDDKITEYFK